MKLLLDTHIWLWSLHEPGKLGKRVLHELKDSQNETWLSPISTWEALTLNAKGRIQLPADVAEWVRRATSPLREAPLSQHPRRVSDQGGGARTC